MRLAIVMVYEMAGPNTANDLVNQYAKYMRKGPQTLTKAQCYALAGENVDEVINIISHAEKTILWERP